MGMFDEFECVPPIVCECGQLLTHLWQSKDGPCNLVKFKQGQQLRADVWTGGESDRLPDSFELYTHCEEWVADLSKPRHESGKPAMKKVGCGRFIEKRGVIENGVWTRVEDGEPEWRPGEESTEPPAPLTDEQKQHINEALAKPFMQLLEKPSFVSQLRAIDEALKFPHEATEHVGAAPVMLEPLPIALPGEDAQTDSVLINDERVKAIAKQAAMLFALGRCIDEQKIVRVTSTPEDIANGVLKLKLLVPAPHIVIELTEPELDLLDGEDDEARRDGSMDRPDQDRGGSDPGTS